MVKQKGDKSAACSVFMSEEGGGWRVEDGGKKRIAIGSEFKDRKKRSKSVLD